MLELGLGFALGIAACVMLAIYAHRQPLSLAGKLAARIVSARWGK